MAIAWFQKICGLKLENFKLAIHCYPDNDLVKTKEFWSQVTGIGEGQFGKTQIDRRKNKLKSNKRKLPYGTAHLTIRANGEKKFGVYLFRKINSWIETTVNQVNAGMV